MIDIAALMFLATMSGTTDVIFHDGYDSGTCPAGRITSSDISYPIGSSGTRRGVDLTHFENIWGHADDTDSTVDWPGRAGASPIIEDFARYGYIAAAFHTPAGLGATLAGFFKNVRYFGGPNLTFSISQQCADFYPAESGCLATNISASDAPMVYWNTVFTGTFHCTLSPDTDYYVNIKLANPTATGPNCFGASCFAHTLNYFGN